MGEFRCMDCREIEGCHHVEATGTACIGFKHKDLKKCSKCSSDDISIKAARTPMADRVTIHTACCNRCGFTVSSRFGVDDCIGKWNEF